MSIERPWEPPMLDANGNLPVGPVGAIADLIPIALLRLPRHDCARCGKRRVLFVLTVYGEPRGSALCAVCAALR